MLEMNLRLTSATKIDPKEYMVGKSPDYDKFKKLCNENAKVLLDKAVVQRMKHKENRQKYYNQLKSIPILKNDYVQFKKSDEYKGKMIPNEEIGWYVKEVVNPDKKYKIKNIFRPSSPALDVSKGHISHFHRPLWKDPMDAFDSTNLRLAVATNQKNEETDKKWKFKPQK